MPDPTVISGEISYDLVMNDDMSFIEGCFRLPYKDWQVIIIAKVPNIIKPEIKLGQWQSGVTGVHILIPKTMRLNSDRVEQFLTSIYGVEYWLPVRGPDSMVLR
jgi:hypothetical protein